MEERNIKCVYFKSIEDIKPSRLFKYDGNERPVANTLYHNLHGKYFSGEEYQKRISNLLNYTFQSVCKIMGAKRITTVESRSHKRTVEFEVSAGGGVLVPGVPIPLSMELEASAEEARSEI